MVWAGGAFPCLGFTEGWAALLPKEELRFREARARKGWNEMRVGDARHGGQEWLQPWPSCRPRLPPRLAQPPLLCPLQGPPLCSAATFQVAGLPPVIRNHQGPTGTPLTPHPGRDHLTEFGGSRPPAAISISAACSGLLWAPGAGPRACSPPACGWGFHSEPLHLEPII